MAQSWPDVSEPEAKILVPRPLDVQSLQGRSTARPDVSVVYHVIGANATSLGNTSLGKVEFRGSSGNGSLAYERNEELARIEIAVLATIFTLAVLGNVCVLVALGRRRRITSRMHMFILHLSVADLLVALCNILPQLAWDLTQTFHGGDFLCRTVTFLQVFVMYLSTYVLVMTAIDRYRAICYPLSNHSWTPRTVNLLVGGVYLLSAVLSIPQPLLFRYQETGEGVEDCRASFDPPWLLHVYILTFTALVYVLPFLLLLFTYGSICYTLWVHQPLTTSTTSTPHHTPARGPALTSCSMVMTKDGEGCVVTVTPTSTPSMKRLTSTTNGWWSPGGRGDGVGVGAPRAHSVRGFSRAKLKTVKLTFVVIVAYLLCWSPFFISHIFWLYDPQQENNSAVVIMVLLSSLNSCCNPWIYLAFSGNLLKNLLPCPLPCCPHPRASHHHHHPLYTPSPSRQRAIEMVGMSPRKTPGSPSPDPDRVAQPAPCTAFCRAHTAASPRHPNPPLRHSSLTSLLTSGMSRHTSAARRQSGPSPDRVLRGGGVCLDGEAVRQGEREGGRGHEDCSANGCVGRRGRLPSPFLLRQQPSTEESCSQGSRDSSSGGTTPRSPHLYKRARLHERPPEEVAEAQLKWEHHTGCRRQSTSCLKFGVDTD